MEMSKILQELTSVNDYDEKKNLIKENPNLSKAQRRKQIRSLPIIPANPIINFSTWWGRDEWRVNNFRYNELGDVAIGQIDGFDCTLVKTYPVFKNPNINFDVGENLCKLGFPFHSITPIYDIPKAAFELPAGALPIPLFPIDGIFTRTIVIEENSKMVEFVETSSPGLRGQSGGPTFDSKGRVWAMQSKTRHHPLGFSPKAPNQQNREHQFLNSGMGSHVNTILDLLKNSNVQVDVSTD